MVSSSMHSLHPCAVWYETILAEKLLQNGGCNTSETWKIFPAYLPTKSTLLMSVAHLWGYWFDFFLASFRLKLVLVLRQCSQNLRSHDISDALLLETWKSSRVKISWSRFSKICLKKPQEFSCRDSFSRYIGESVGFLDLYHEKLVHLSKVCK